MLDFDGLVIDSERVAAEVFLEVMAEQGASVELAEITHLFGTTEADAEWEALLAARCSLSMAEIEVLMTPRVRAAVDQLPLLPGVDELLDAARAAEIRVGLGTGHDPRLLEPRLDRLGLRFDAVVTRADVERGKPAPDIFLEVARRLGVDPHECLVLEDSLPGCEAAIAAGMQVVACPSVVTAHCEFPPEAQRVRSLLELLDGVTLDR